MVMSANLAVSRAVARAADHQRVIKFDFTETRSDHGLRLPVSVSSISVRPVCRTDFDHSVSPCRSSNSRWLSTPMPTDYARQSRFVPRHGEKVNFSLGHDPQARKFAPTAHNYAVARLPADVGLRINKACSGSERRAVGVWPMFVTARVLVTRVPTRGWCRLQGADRSLCWFMRTSSACSASSRLARHGCFPPNAKTPTAQHDYGGQIVTVTYLKGAAGRGRRRGR